MNNKTLKEKLKFLDEIKTDSIKMNSTELLCTKKTRVSKLFQPHRKRKYYERIFFPALISSFILGLPLGYLISTNSVNQHMIFVLLLIIITSIINVSFIMFFYMKYNNQWQKYIENNLEKLKQNKKITNILGDMKVPNEYKNMIRNYLEYGNLNKYNSYFS